MAEWTPLGDRAVRFARPEGPSARAIVRAVRAWPGVVDVVVAKRDVAAYFDGAPAMDEGRLRSLANEPDDPAPVRDVEIRVTYDGPDLDDVAKRVGLSIDDVVRIHASATYVVDTMGFAPGFAYLSGLDERLWLPRRSTPRPRVPAGSVGIAGEQTGVYPFDSPGGWHLLGRAHVRMFGPEGSLLHAGDRVRFIR